MPRRSLAGALALGALLIGGCGGATGSADTGAGSLPFDGRSPLVPPAKETRVLVELRRPSLATQATRGHLTGRRQRAYVSSLRGEVRALRSALEAKGVRLRNPVLFARVWNGFAATVDTADLPEVRALGLRAEPVRRFYGAGTPDGRGQMADGRGQMAEDIWQMAEGRGQMADGRGRPVVALLDSSGRHGTQMAQVLAQALGPRGGGILRIPVGGPRPDPVTGGRTEFGTTDQLLAGLERAVDPNGDGDTSDHLPVALVGMNSPYAGFSGSPEAVGAGAARALGTLVVAPAGNEGPGAGTVGSPAAAPGVLAVGALDGAGAPALPEVRIGLATSEGRALLRGALLGGDGRALRAQVATLTGPSQASPRERGRALGGSTLEYFGVDAAPRAKGRAVIVPARRGAATGPALSVRAAAAAEAGAAVLVVCEPDGRRDLTALPGSAAAPIPVVGLRGSAAARALDLTPHGGGLAFVSAPRRRTAPGPLTPATTSSRGPSYSLAPKPDIAAPGTARLGSGAVVAGTSVAAARVAAAAVAVHARNPAARPDDLAAALVGTAQRLGPTLWAGAGRLQAAAAPAARVLIEPSALALPRQAPAAPFAVSRRVTLVNPGAPAVTVRLSGLLRGAAVNLFPATLTLAPHQRKRVTLTVSAAGRGRSAGFVSGRIIATGAGPPIMSVVGVPIGPPPPARLGSLALVATGGRTDGVRFTAGSLTERGGVRAVEPLGTLELQLVDASGKVVRDLTPPGGATDLLPAEYAYTLTKSARSALASGRYSFLARGRGPAGGPEVVRKSPSFTLR